MDIFLKWEEVSETIVNVLQYNIHNEIPVGKLPQQYLVWGIIHILGQG